MEHNSQIDALVYEYALTKNKHDLVAHLRPRVSGAIDQSATIKARELIYDLCQLEADADRGIDYRQALEHLESLAGTLDISTEEDGYMGLHLALRTQVSAASGALRRRPAGTHLTPASARRRSSCPASVATRRSPIGSRGRRS